MLLAWASQTLFFCTVVATSQQALVPQLLFPQPCGICSVAATHPTAIIDSTACSAVFLHVQCAQQRAGVRFMRHDVLDEFDHRSTVARMYGVRSVPTFLFFVEGALVSY
jgi:hypothetical protein